MEKQKERGETTTEKGDGGKGKLKRTPTFRFDKILLGDASRKFVRRTVITIERGPGPHRERTIHQFGTHLYEIKL